MKKILLILLCVVIVNVIGMLLFLPNSPFNIKKETLYIALVGPMTGQNKENGQAMLEGVKLYLDNINKKPVFKDKKIELLVFDDKDKQIAIKIANQIANDNKILLVLGHFNSTNSYAAGTIYKKSGIPAITASATAESVTMENEWYFRTVPKNRFIADFIVNYIKEILNRTEVSIIYSTDEYGDSLARQFEVKAKELEIKIKKKWSFNPRSEYMDKELNNIIGELRSTSSPGMIFFATSAKEAIKILSSSRYPGTDYPVIGADSFSNPSFIPLINQHPAEQKNPGYYTDYIYAVTPFFTEISGEQATDFRSKFLYTHKKEASWVAACYYDAIQVAFEAIKRAEIQGEDIRNNRKKIRDALARFNSPDMAVRGVSGDIYFDHNGDVHKGMWVGVYLKQAFLPAFIQYESTSATSDDSISAEIPLSETEPGQSMNQKKHLVSQATANNETIQTNEENMKKIRVVYCGAEINEICDIDFAAHTYTIDFYLWFRFQGDFDDTRIQFTNSVNPVVLGQPYMEDTITDNITTRTYRIRAKFKSKDDRSYYSFNFHTYPFEKQILYISFYHKDMPGSQLIYMPDLPGMSGFKDKKHFKIRNIAGWRVASLDFYQYMTGIAVGKQPISYSCICNEVRIKRKNMTGFAIINFLPIVVMAIMIYIVYLMPPGQITVRAFVFLIIPLIAGTIQYGIHLKGISGKLIIDYAFFTLYGLAGAAGILSVLIYLMHKRNVVKKIEFFTRSGKIFHICCTSAAVLLIVYFYVINFR